MRYILLLRGVNVGGKNKVVMRELSAILSAAGFEDVEERAALPDWWHGEMARREVVHLGRHAVFWGKYDEAEYLKTIYHKKLMKQAFYREVTIRNGNTYEKIAAILENET